MSDDVVIRVEGLGKRYRLTHQLAAGQRFQYKRMSDMLFNVAKALRSAANAGPVSEDNSQEDFWALKDVSFEIKRGEAVGIIGRNGAGKSTLLKILSRITEPTTGTIEIDGRVASLLEVGTGFHPELTGRENIFLNGAILGMMKAEIKRKFDEIVAFAEVERFLDTPVKHYSSGMYVRLAFAVAAHLEPEILIVDEVLAVGDHEFQKKCMGKMKDVATGGRTVIFVSHSIPAISRLCQKGIALDRGVVGFKGDINSVVNHYLNSGKYHNSSFTVEPGRSVGNDTVQFKSVTLHGDDGSTGPTFLADIDLVVSISYQVLRPRADIRLGFHLHGQDGAIVFNTTDADSNVQQERPVGAGVFISSCIIPRGFLNAGRYSLTIGSDTTVGVNFYCENIVAFGIEGSGLSSRPGSVRPGYICPNLSWKIEVVSADK